MAAREEQETTVTMGRIDEHMSIWTNNVVHVRALEREDRAVRRELKDASEDDISAYLEAGFGFTYDVAAEDARILNVFARKRKPMTEEERKAAGERLRAGKS